MSYVGESSGVCSSIAENYKKTFEECTGGVVKCESYPNVVQLCISSMCNMNPRCGMCLTPNSGSLIDKGVLEKVKKELLPYPLLVNLTVDGEPTVHPEIENIIDSISGWVGIQTNGIQDTDVYRRICPKLKNIFFSVDGAISDTYEKIRGPHFNKVIDNIRCAVEIRNTINSNLFIRMDFVVMQLNKTEMNSFIDLGVKLGVDGIYFSPIFNVGAIKKIRKVNNFIFAYEKQLIPQREFITLVQEQIELWKNIKIKIEV